MKITTAQFIKGIVGPSPLLRDGRPQVAFIGRSNVGKSSVINAITKVKDLAITSSSPGRTQQINAFLINDSWYLMDLPGYGYAKMSRASQDKLTELIDWYLFQDESPNKKVVVIIDANVGLTNNDREMITALKEYNKNFIVVANKIDKIKKSHAHMAMKKIKEELAGHLVIPFSAKIGTGIGELVQAIL